MPTNPMQGREYETNPDPRFNPKVAEMIRKSIQLSGNKIVIDIDRTTGEAISELE